MKYIKNISAILLLLIFTIGCNDDFLTLAPKDELSEATMFDTYDNCKVFAWGYYESLNPYPRGGENGKRYRPTIQDCDADLLENGYSTNGETYIWKRENIPASDADWTEGYKKIRRTNLMLDNLENSNMTELEQAHWRGVALFFRSFEYFQLLKKFGGVPWVENAINEQNEDILFGPRATRDEVAANILRDLNFAIDNIKEEGDGENTVNADVARALMSRYGLFEGTWRKYHNLGNSETYLQASIDASSVLIQKHPDLMPVYDHIFNSEDLIGQPGILLYRHYIQDDAGYHIGSTNVRSTNEKVGITRRGIDLFLCKDGKSIYNSDLYQGDKDKYAEFRNRDTRILVMTPPSYKVNSSGTGNWSHTGVDADKEWFDEMVRVSGAIPDQDLTSPFKQLPDRNWSDRITTEVPNFTGLLPTQTATGYRFWKYFSNVSFRTSSRDYNDGPIFRMGEVLVNHAEAMFELGRFDQNVANATINKTRARGEVAPMEIGQIDASFDPSRDPSVDPILWEIRRERGIELMGEGFRTPDLRRWKKMDWATEPKLGRWIKQSDYPGKVIPIQGSAAEGYVQLVSGNPPAFEDYYYLYPIPSEEIVLNPQLEQNPGWQ
ncbi:MAG: RagB/SusD family nutrient uptake outer membrane protein [Mariniphaga sp.]|jgi:hypothetical protein|nr:RagB/SusD family nutrient uptake outer membrane protein [Mariniphaga sp.]